MLDLRDYNWIMCQGVQAFLVGQSCKSAMLLCAISNIAPKAQIGLHDARRPSHFLSGFRFLQDFGAEESQNQQSQPKTITAFKNPKFWIMVALFFLMSFVNTMLDRCQSSGTIFQSDTALFLEYMYV